MVFGLLAILSSIPFFGRSFVRMAKPKLPISKEMTIAQVLQSYPHLIQVFQSFGLACPSCFAAESDTIERVSLTYGLNPDIVVQTLNVALLLPHRKGCET